MFTWKGGKIMDVENEVKADQLTDAFLDFTKQLVASPNEARQQGVPENLNRMLSRSGRPKDFAGLDAVQYEWYPRFGRHEWEDFFFKALAEYWDVIAAAVLIPAARDIGKDEIKKAYGWIRGKVVGLIDQIRGQYENKNVTERDEIPRFDEMRAYIKKGLDVLERTGMNNFTSTEFASMAGLDENLAIPLLILCQFREENGHWRRSPV